MISSQTALKAQVSPWRRFLRTPGVEESTLVECCAVHTAVPGVSLVECCAVHTVVKGVLLVDTQLYRECHWCTHSCTVIFTGGVHCGTNSCTVVHLT